MTLHIYTADKTKRIRRQCPYHKRLCYGGQADFYDTVKVFFDCGTSVDYGYSEWTPPKLYKRLVLFKDETGYTILAKYTGDLLVRQVSRSQAMRIAKQRLAKGGHLSVELE